MAEIGRPQLKVKGLYTHPNPLGSVPEGALLKAKNCVIDKDDIVETKRGTQKYIQSMASASKSLHRYKKRAIVHFGSTLGYDSDGAGTKIDYSGTYSAPSGRRMRSIRSQQNFYFTTSAGVKKLDALAGPVMNAGGPKALDGTAALNGSSGFMSNNTQVAYRVVWGYIDVNDNLILGAPSQRITVSNSAGATRDVQLTFTIPDEVTTSYFYQLYRSGESASSTTEPDDELQLVVEGNPTSAEISAQQVVVVDSTPDALKGATLYTSPSQQGIAQANDVPPLCKDMTVFKDHALYANTETKQRFFLTIISVGSGQLGYYQPTADTNTNDTLTNVSSFTGIAVGQQVTGTDIPAGTTITAIDSGAGTITMSQAATGSSVGVTITARDRITIDGTDYWANSSEVPASQYFLADTSGTPAQNIDVTAKSLVAVVNQNAANVYGFYISNFDDLPGQMLFEDKTFGGTVWYATSSKGSALSPILDNTGTNDPSTNEAKKNRVYIAKPRQPEAVPITQYLDVGSEDDEILRIIALRDSCIVLKEDGIFRWTGEAVDSFVVRLFDNTAIIKGADSADVLNNQVFCHSTQGVISIADNGVQVLSRPIESDLLLLATYTNFETASFGVGYESERKYIFFTVKDSADTYAKQAWVYNTFTNSWTRWEENRNCGIVIDDVLYLGDADANHVRKERKTFKVTDHANDEYALTISSHSGTTVTVNSTADAVVGQTLAQVDGDGNITRQAKVTEVTDGTHLEVDRTALWLTGAAKLYDPFAIEIQWAPIHGGNPGILKQFPEVSLFFREARFRNLALSFSTNFSEVSSAANISPIPSGTWGAGGFGSVPWGGGAPAVQPIRTYVPIEQQRAHWLNIEIDHSEAATLVAIAGFSVPMIPMSTRFT